MYFSIAKILVILHLITFAHSDLPVCPIEWRLPCPPPPWPPTYNMQLSTQNYFSSSEGFFDNATVTFAALHGVIGIDGSNHYGTSTHREETLAQQAAIIKSLNPKMRIFVYRQSELALNIFDNGAKVMYDPTKTNWFVLFPNGTIYNDSNHIYSYRMDQFCWDHRNPDVRDYFVDYYIGSAFNQSVVDGIFYDDDAGIWQERTNYPDYPDSYRIAIDAAQQVSLKRAWELGLKYNKHAWQAWLTPDIPNSGDTPATCAAKMRTALSMKDVPVTFPAMYNGACSQPWDQCPNLKEQLAAFLIARGDYWLFFTPLTWWKEGFERDYGVPVGDAQELFPNFFIRKWSNCTIYLDCNTFTSDFICATSPTLTADEKSSYKYSIFVKYLWYFYRLVCAFCRLFHS